MKRIDLSSFFGVLVLCVMALRQGGMAGDPGAGWHVASGEWMLSHREILTTDPFSPRLRPWIHTQWLSDLWLGILSRIGSWPLLEAFFIGLGVLLCAVLLPFFLRRQQVHPLAEFLGVIAAFLLVHLQWFLRPTFFSFLLAALLFLFLNPRERLYRYRYLLPLLFVFWANIHSGFLLGFFLLGAHLASVVWTREHLGRELVLVFLCVAATLLTPYGLALIVQGVELASNRYFQTLNEEWYPPDFRTGWGLLFLGAAVASLSIVLFSRSGNAFERIVLIVLVALSFKARRSIPFLAFPFGYLAALSLSEFFGKSGGVRLFSRLGALHSYPRPPLVAALALLLFVLLFGHLPLRDANDSAPPDLQRYREEFGFCEKGSVVFASPDLGGTLIFSGFRPVIDDRNELQGEAAYRRYFRIIQVTPGWEELFAALNPDCVIALPQSPLAQELLARGWTQKGEAFRRKGES